MLNKIKKVLTDLRSNSTIFYLRKFNLMGSVLNIRLDSRYCQLIRIRIYKLKLVIYFFKIKVNIFCLVITKSISFSG
ncbi:hypothetical protein MCAPa_7110 [Mycoplasma capricolum subsp. capricolum 14232]|uniref:Uncharacterized protein n=1 Tax=Mycoplasma capricolum subsp. capricolum 14232 TaxID=1188238 RepID=A0A084EJ47_MYCCA|nr:hypothetical protein MCAPa_7110 [Mycoplasma capricolum subsp. capricolum 14232]